MTSRGIAPFATPLRWLMIGITVGLLVDRAWLQWRGSDASPTPSEPRVSRTDQQAHTTSPTTEEKIDTAPGNVLEKFGQQTKALGTVDMIACLALIERLSSSECYDALKTARMCRGEDGQLLLRAIARRWAKLDPDGLVNLLWTPNGPRDAENMLAEEAARELVRRNPEAALAKLDQIPGGLRRVILANTMVVTLAKENPARAAVYLTEHRDLGVNPGLFGAVAKAWASQDPAAALRWAETVPASQAREEGLNGAWQGWAEHDPAAAAAEISRSPAVRFSQSVWQGVAASFVAKDAEAALRWIESLPRKEDREMALTRFNPTIQQMGGGEQMLELIKKIPFESTKENVARNAAYEIARDDPGKALAWAEQLPTGSARNEALNAVIREMALRMPARAVEYVTSMPESSLRTGLMQRVVGDWAGQDPASVMAWLRQLPPSEERDSLASEAGGAARRYDPVRGAQWLDLLTIPEKRSHFVQTLAGAWATTDGAAAAEWVGNLPDASLHTQGHFALARQWSFVDPEATAKWLESLPDGAARNSAISGFIQNVHGSDPPRAIVWAGQITDASEREKAMRLAFPPWTKLNAPAARAWLETAPITESLRAEFGKALDGSAQPDLRR